jgi:LysM repeat protein
MKYTSLEGQIRRLLTESNTDKRRTIKNVARPDDVGPTSEKSKLAKQAEIKTKVIDEASGDELEQFLKQNPSYKRGSEVSVGQEFTYGDRTEKARAGEGPYQVLQRLKSRGAKADEKKPEDSKPAQNAAQPASQQAPKPEQKVSQPDQPQWSNEIDPKVADTVRKDAEKMGKAVPYDPYADKPRIVKKDGAFTLAQPDRPYPIGPDTQSSGQPSDAGPKPTPKSPEPSQSRDSGGSQPAPIKFPEPPASRDSGGSQSTQSKATPPENKALDDFYQSSVQSFTPYPEKGKIGPSDLGVSPLAVAGAKSIPFSTVADYGRTQSQKKMLDTLGIGDEQPKQPAAPVIEPTVKPQNKTQAPENKGTSYVDMARDLLSGAGKKISDADDWIETNIRKPLTKKGLMPQSALKPGVSEETVRPGNVNFKPKTDDSPDDERDISLKKTARKKLFKDEGIHEQMFGTVGKSAGSKLRSALMRRRQLERQSQTKQMNLHAGDNAFEPVREDVIPLPPKRDPLERLTSLNPEIKDPNKIYVGQKIKTNTGEYTVAKGDTLSGISQMKYKGTAPVLPKKDDEQKTAAPTFPDLPTIPGGTKPLTPGFEKLDIYGEKPRKVKTTREPFPKASELKKISPSLDVDATARALGEGSLFSGNELDHIISTADTKQTVRIDEEEASWGNLFPKSKTLGSTQAYNAAKAASEKYGVPIDVVAGVFAHETGQGQAFDSRNNPGGIMDPKTNWKKKQAFSDLETGIDSAVKVVATNYNKVGGDINKMGARYAPVGAENDPKGLNRDWAPGVSSYMKQFRGSLGLTPSPTEPPKPVPEVKKPETRPSIQSTPAPVATYNKSEQPSDEKKLSKRQRFNQALAAAKADPNIGPGGVFDFEGGQYKVEQVEVSEASGKKSRTPTWRRPSNPLMKWQERVNKAIDNMNLPTVGDQAGQKGDQSGMNDKSNTTRYSISDEYVQKFNAVLEAEQKRSGVKSVSIAGSGYSKPETKAEVETRTKREPRNNAMVVFGSIAAGGRGSTVDEPGTLTHDNGEKTKVTPAMARQGLAQLNSLKPADKHDALNKIHGSAQIYREFMGIK